MQSRSVLRTLRRVGWDRVGGEVEQNGQVDSLSQGKPPSYGRKNGKPCGDHLNPRWKTSLRAVE